MYELIQGDNGTILQTTINDDKGIVNIQGATVEFTIKSSTKRSVKTGTVTDGSNGICQLVLTSDDLQDIGNYVFQVTVRFMSGQQFSSNIQKFKVSQKL